LISIESNYKAKDVIQKMINDILVGNFPDENPEINAIRLQQSLKATDANIAVTLQLVSVIEYRLSQLYVKKSPWKEFFFGNKLLVPLARKSNNEKRAMHFE
jgi:hypothetical protein